MNHQNKEVSDFIYSEKYLQAGETFEEGMTRIAGALEDNNEEHFRTFRDILLDQRFLPAGRIQVAVGATRSTTPYNCLGGGTEIITSKGVKTLHEVANTTVTLLDGNRQWTDAFIHAHGFGHLTLNVKLTNGRKTQFVVATRDHEWVVDGHGERVKTSDLKRNMRVPHLSPIKISDPLAEVHGLIYGDGSKTNDKTPGYVLHVCAEHDVTYDLLDKFGFPYSETDRGRLYYFFGENIYTNYKELPTNPTSEYVVGFTRGLFLADGCLTSQPEYIITGNYQLVDWFRKFGPLGGFYKTGQSELSPITNYGTRTRPTFNIRFDLRSIEHEDVMKGTLVYGGNDGWRVAEVTDENHTCQGVYCPSVPTTKSFVLASGALMGNCFVSGTIPDSMEGICNRLTESLQTMRLGGGIGYDFSTLRPAGEHIASVDSNSCGPVGDEHRSKGFMDLFDAGCAVISSAGHRRGAQMAVLRVDHPDIRHFIHCKRNQYRLTNFNISVGVTDDFMEAVRVDGEHNLHFGGRVYETVRARNLWDEIMRSTWDYAEPGVLYLDIINRKNNLWYCENIVATNPCAEQPLPPFGACLLGSFNLTRYLVKHFGFDEKEGHGEYWFFDWEKFKNDIPPVVRAMDNVIDRAIYPLSEQEKEAKSKRRMGLGITGLANTAEILGFPYGSKEMLDFMEQVLIVLRDTAYLSSVELAIEKGPFETFDPFYYSIGLTAIPSNDNSFVSTLPLNLQNEINKHGIRNSHLLSIAPTGTISLAAGNVSSGVEPPYTSGLYSRSIYQSDGSTRNFSLMDFAESEYGVVGVTSEECSVEDHVRVLCLASKYVDSSVSKTCNVGPEVSFPEFKDIYLAAYRGGASGITTFRPAEYGGKREGILSKPLTGLTMQLDILDDMSDEDIIEYDRTHDIPWFGNKEKAPPEDGAVGGACLIDDQGNRSCG